MKLKRIINLLLAVAIILQSSWVIAADETKESLTYETQVISELGIMEVGKDYNASSEITRVDFAKAVYNLVNFANQNNSGSGWDFYAKDKTENKEITEIDYRYADVDDEIDGYKEIEALAQSGIMLGDGSGNFNPMDSITKKQAVTVMLRVLGYTILENYTRDFDNYYQNVVTNLKLLEQTDKNITYAETARLFYNTMVSKPLTMSSNKELKEGDKTFMEKYMHISYIMGTVTNTGFVALKPGEDLNSDRIIINETKELYKENDNQYAELIGRNVNCFYYNDDSEQDGQIAFIAKSDRNTETVITADSDIGFDRNSYSITYTDNARTKSYKLHSGFVVIKNNKILESYSESDFEINAGNVTIVKNDNKDIVVISSYDDVYVKGLDKENFKIYNGIKYAGKTVLELEDKDYRIVNQSGEELTFEKIKDGNILSICEGETYIDIIVSEIDGVSDIVSGVTSGDGKTVLTLQKGGRYTVSKYYSSSADAIAPQVREEYYFYFNVFGEIAYISEEGITADGEMPYGYCWHIKENEEDEEVIFAKILNQKNEWQNYTFADSFTFARQDGKEIRINKKSKFFGRLIEDYGEKTYRGILRYTLDDKGKINYFEVPISDTTSEKKGQLKYMGSVKNKTWIVNGENLAPNIIVRNSVKMITQKPQAQDESGNLIERSQEDYAVKNVSFANWSNVTLDAYTINGDSPRADYVIRTTNDTAVNLSPNNISYAVALSDLYYTLDEYEDETILAMDVMNCVNESDSDVFSTTVETFSFLDEKAAIARDSFKNSGSDATYEISKGDIFRYARDSDGKIIETMLVWDKSEENKISKDYPMGNIAGSIGYYAPEAGGFTNPFAIGGEGVAKQDDVGVDTPINYRVLYGGIYKKYKNNVIRITTQPIYGSGVYDKTGNPKFIDESLYIQNSNRIINVTLDGKKVSTRTGTLSDIKPYDEYGKDCSRVVACYYLGVVKWVFVINGK